MAKIKVTGDTLMVISEITHEDFMKAKKFRPDSLKIKDKEDNEIFAVNFGNSAIRDFGVTFSSVNAEGYLFTSTNAPIQGVHTDPEREKELVIEEYSQILCKLNMVEAQVAKEMEAIKEISEAIAENVTVE